MKTVGIICEYDPLHLGHRKQLDMVKTAGNSVVCIMSGNFVQRGKPAIIDKTLRARAAVLCGADLVLELPLTATLSSAEGFASEGVRLLSPFCDGLCFGAEDADKEQLISIAKTLLSEDFSPALREELDKGLSFPAARQAALERMGLDGAILGKPNNILGIEYCKAILAQKSSMEPMPIHRAGGYHDESVDAENPSATAVRKLMLSNYNVIPSQRARWRGNLPDLQASLDKTPQNPLNLGDCHTSDIGHWFAMTHNWRALIPEEAVEVFEESGLHSLAAGERAILCKLRSMTDEEFEALPYGSEGLWRKLMHASRSKAMLEQIAVEVKSKRYTRSRIDRMILCAFLGLTAEDLASPAPYARVLAFNDKGREILKNAREHGLYPNIGEKIDHPYQQIEYRADALYGLFALDGPEPPDTKRRVSYLSSTKRG